MNRRNFIASLCFTPLVIFNRQGLPGEGRTFHYANRFVFCYFGEIRKFGGLIYKCYFLESGELVIDYNYLPPVKYDKVSIREYFTLFDPDVRSVRENVYEYRSSVLINGSIKLHSEEFVPTTGSKIISFSSYKEGMDRIYNLPGFFATVRMSSSDTYYDAEQKRYWMSDAQKKLLVASVENLPGYYFHKRLRDKLGDHICFGYVLDNGNFNYDLKPGIIRDPEAIKKIKLPPNLYAPQSNEEFVYEFRSERLITGKLTGTAFVPEVGSEIASYEEYKSKKIKPWRIYNLPQKYKQ